MGITSGIQASAQGVVHLGVRRDYDGMAVSGVSSSPGLKSKNRTTDRPQQNVSVFKWEGRSSQEEGGRSRRAGVLGAKGGEFGGGESS